MTFASYFLVSGLAQGDDPAGGLGVARCLRTAFPRARIVGIDYSVRAAALHDPVFDDVLIKRPWGEFDSEDLIADVRAVVDEAQGCFIPTIDLEAYWLSRHFGDHPRVLSPPESLFSQIAKPLSDWPALGGAQPPPCVLVSDGQEAMHAFGRKQGWRLWLKGPYHDAIFIQSWEEVPGALARLRKYWDKDGVHLQRHVEGVHESIAFCAFGGELLDAIWIVKNDMTSQGKTVAGSALDMNREDRVALADFIARTGWTGGGEVELIRGPHNELWLIEVNPRFPSWIDGARHLGVNLPARMVAHVFGTEAPGESLAADGFVRVQTEIPAQRKYKLLEPIQLEPGEPLDAAKTAFTIHEIATHIERSIGLPTPPEDDRSGAEKRRHEDDAWFGGLGSKVSDSSQTPSEVFLPDILSRQLDICDELIASTSDPKAPEIKLAYSVKTNPDRRVLQAVLARGYGAEVISEAEWNAARREAGFSAAEITVNGPGKSDLFIERILKAGGIWIADSVDELRRGLAAFPEGLPREARAGVRLCPPRVPSRFGVPVGDLRSESELASLLTPDSFPGGLIFHLHLPQALVGEAAWRDRALDLVYYLRDLCDDCGVEAVALDIGGGAYPADFHEVLKWTRDEFSQACVAALPSVRAITLEPGRAIVQNCFAIRTRVLEKRETESDLSVIVDTSIGDVPEATHYPHPVYNVTKDYKILDANSRETGAKNGRVLGWTCMEADILAMGLDLRRTDPGDELLILSAGSYDRSMAYGFGRG